MYRWIGYGSVSVGGKAYGKGEVFPHELVDPQLLAEWEDRGLVEKDAPTKKAADPKPVETKKKGGKK